MANHSPDLRFFESGTSSGFTPAGIATFDDLQPAAVVRELIQNSLDAARVADVKPAKLQFKVTRAHRDDVPGMKSYEETFRKAVRTQRGQIEGPAKQVIDRINNELNQNEIDVLSILDNGIGLDEQLMNALLSDGVSYKDGDATGTYGNGHSTAIPASNLRYVLYGGVTKDGSRICSGHAVLASHKEEDQKQPRDGNGYFVKDFKAGPNAMFDCATGSHIPKLIANNLDTIENEFGHGTAVIIPAFNNLMEKDNLWEMVSHSASANFFAAIANGELEVSVEIDRREPNDDIWELNKQNLKQRLIDHSGKKATAKFLNGNFAYEAYRTYISKGPSKIQTKHGIAEVRIRNVPTGNTRVHLCRNGMWITDRIPVFTRKFADRIPFNAIVSLNAEDGGNLHKLMRDAEGPLHNEVLLKRLEANRRRQCTEALQEVVDWILINTTKADSNAYSPDDFLVLDSGEQHGGGGQSHAGFTGAPVVVNRQPFRQLRDESGHKEESGLEPSVPLEESKSINPPNRTRKRRRPTLPSFFQSVSRPVGNNRRKIYVKCNRKCIDAEMRLVVDEALDATCDRHGQDTYSPVTLRNVSLGGLTIEDKELSRMDGRTIGVPLGNLKARSTFEIEVDYELHGDFANVVRPSLRVEIFKREGDSGANTVSDAKQE